MATGIPLVHRESGGTFLAVDDAQVAALARKGWEPAPETPPETAVAPTPAPARPARPAAATPEA